MNKTVVFVTFTCLALVGIIGAALLLLFKAEGYGNFVALLLQILGLVTIAAGTFAALGNQDKKLEVVKKQTNGTLSDLLSKIEEKDNINRQLTEQLVELKKSKGIFGAMRRDYEND